MRRNKVVLLVLSFLLVFQAFAVLPLGGATTSAEGGGALPDGWDAALTHPTTTSVKNTDASFDAVNNEFRIVAEGGNLNSDGQDAFFSYMTIPGDTDFKLSARITSFEGAGSGSGSDSQWAVLMVNTGLEQSSKFLAYGMRNIKDKPDKVHLRSFRNLNNTGAGADVDTNVPVYVMLERVGEDIMLKHSQDGTEWTIRATQKAGEGNGGGTEFLVQDTLNIGFAVSRSSATFDNVVFKVDGVEVFTSETAAPGEEPKPEVPGEGDSTALKTAISTANDLLESHPEGEELDHAPKEARDALELAIADAESAIANEANLTQTELNSATSLLNAAINTFKLLVIKPDPTEGMINIAGDSVWKGSIMGDIGGNPTAEHFEITEDNGTVKLRASNNKGKIASSSEGIAYYFQDIKPEDNFEFRAKAKIDAWDKNNQVSFGIMLRSNVAMNENIGSDFTGDYVAIGAIKQDMLAFTKKKTENFKEIDLGLSADIAVGQTYNLSITKAGDNYFLGIDGETVSLEDFDQELHYAGLFVARNTTVTFSEINLDIERPVEVDDEWSFRAFGGNTSASKNPNPTVNDDGSISIVTDNGGKIASGDVGISFYYKEISGFANFELKTIATVDRFPGNNNQQSFGLMLLDELGEAYSTTEHTANYVALGPLDSANDNLSLRGIKPFYKAESQTKLPVYDNKGVPVEGNEYELSIKKSGNTYVFSVDGEVQSETITNIFTDNIFAGLYAAREADVTFSDFELVVDYRKVSSIKVNKAPDKVEYLLGTALVLDGIEVEVTYDDDSTEMVGIDDLIVSGYDSNSVGPVTVTVVYGGKTATFTVEIIKLTITEATVEFTPAKTQYYIDDRFDPKGLSVIATFDSGLEQKLSNDIIDFTIAEAEEIPATEDTPKYYVFKNAGIHEVIINTIETDRFNPATEIQRFNIEVEESVLESITITNNPAKSIYYIGDELDLSGIVVYANYDDGSQIRLLRDEFTASNFNSNAADEEQEITITHKGKNATFIIEVKVKEIEGLIVTSYPKTTYELGEAFTSEGLGVSKLYDNDDVELYSDFEVNSSEFDGSTAGTYDITIIPDDIDIASIVYQVTVREATEVEWKQIVFGQSTSLANDNNHVKVDTPVDGTITLEALGGSAGKITGDHDGISFYYTELDAATENFVLSATIKVNGFVIGKPTTNGQDAFGIMVRDAIGEHGDAGVFSSNIAAVGGISGGSSRPMGIQVFARTGVIAPDGQGSHGLQMQMLKQESIANINGSTYKLTLAKTNSGITGQIGNEEPKLLYIPDVLNVQDEKMYVGFFAARDAIIEVSDIELTTTLAATDPPKVDAPAVPVQPDFEILSLAKSPLTEYNLIVQANVDGTFLVRKDSVSIGETVAEKDNLVTIPTELIKDGNTNFSITFIPDDTQYLTSYETLVFNLVVQNKSFGEENGNIYVSPTGLPTGEGTEADPLDLDTAIDFVRAGQTIMVTPGEYKRTNKLDIKKFNDGTEDAKKYLIGVPDSAGNNPVIDFQKVSEGVLLSGDYWHVSGLDIARAANNYKGFVIGGNYNIVENSRFYENGDTGLQISRTDYGNSIEEWPSYNIVRNSISFDNRDSADTNADGFAAKLTVGVGNKFIGLIAHNNIDDGFDLYTKLGTGPIGAVTIENSIAYNNGTLTDGYEGEAGKNGFKLGGEGIHVPHVIKNSIAFNNGGTGFTSNSNPGVIAINNIGFNNEGPNISFTTYSGIETDFTIDGFISYLAGSKDSVPSYTESSHNYFYNGTDSVNNAGVKLTDDNFRSLDHGTLPFERDADGSIILGDFLSFIPPSTSVDRTPSSQDQTQYDHQTNKVIVNVSANALRANLAMTPADAKGKKQVNVNVTSDSSVSGFNVNIPASVFSDFDKNVELLLNSGDIQVGIPGDMFSNERLAEESEVTISVEKVDAEQLSGELLETIGDRPIYNINLLVDGQHASWNNPNSSVNISIAYTPTAEELANHQFIVAWYIDRDGNIIPVNSSKYDENSGTLNFSTNHFSHFAVAYDQKTFTDLARYSWAKHEIDVLATRGIINGVTAERFAPERHITRADLTLLLVRALGLATPHSEHFADVPPDAYYYDGVGVAKAYGIIEGRNDGLFYPTENITRQDMFVIAARALRQLEQLVGEADQSVLADYTDQALISNYALDELATLIENGLVEGNNNRLNPLGLATRAEAAVFIYRLFYLEE